MERKTVERLLAVQDMAGSDPQYGKLLPEYRRLDKALLAALPDMTPAQREIVMDYVGCVHEMNRRLLELSCTYHKKS